MPTNNIRRILTADEIKYMTENSGKIPITEIAKELRLSGVQIRLFAKDAGIILNKCKTTPGRQKVEVPKFTGKSSATKKAKQPKVVDESAVVVKKRKSKVSEEKLMEECFANPLLKVDIIGGQVLFERPCVGAWT